MRLTASTRQTGARYLAGDEVEVLSRDELLQSLDDAGTLGGLPLMPEMLALAGTRARVSKRADKTCWANGLRSMEDTVHLEGLRCDGGAHGGCQAGCLLFWREAWLRPVDRRSGRAVTIGSEPQVSAADLLAAAGPHHEDESTPGTWICQATSLRTASRPLRWWDARHLVRDVTTGNVPLHRVVRYLLPYAFNALQTWSRLHLPHRFRFRDGMWYPFIRGVRSPTPVAQLGLPLGARVRVKDRSSVESTLSPTGHNRGLSFDVEMLEHCGRESTIRTRVERVIDEQTGQMHEITGDCLILDDFVCTAKYHGFCSRETYPFFREIWLEPVDPVRPPGDVASSPEAAALPEQ